MVGMQILQEERQSEITPLTAQRIHEEKNDSGIKPHSKVKKTVEKTGVPEKERTFASV